MYNVGGVNPKLMVSTNAFYRSGYKAQDLLLTYLLLKYGKYVKQTVEIDKEGFF